MHQTNRIATCMGCQAKASGLKSRIAIPHTCGLEPLSSKTKLFYAIEDEYPFEDVEPTINHKWGKWEKKEVPIEFRMLGVTYKQERKCNVCDATQTKTYYKNQAWPELRVMRNCREDVDCNDELKTQSKT